MAIATETKGQSPEKLKVGLLLPESGLGDLSFNDMAYTGLLKVQSERDIEIIVEVIKGLVNASREAALEKLLEKGVEVVVVNGFEFEQTIKNYAPLYQNIKFIINDVAVDDLPNVYSTLFKQEEASFLAGVLAARMTKTDKIGFIGGKKVRAI